MGFLSDVESRLDLPPGERVEVMRELKSHYLDIREELSDCGISDEEADRMAETRLGDPTVVASHLMCTHCRSTWVSAILTALPYLALPIVVLVAPNPYLFTHVWGRVAMALLAVLAALIPVNELRFGRRSVWLITWFSFSIVTFHWLVWIPLLRAWILYRSNGSITMESKTLDFLTIYGWPAIVAIVIHWRTSLRWAVAIGMPALIALAIGLMVSAGKSPLLAMGWVLAQVFLFMAVILLTALGLFVAHREMNTNHGLFYVSSYLAMMGVLAGLTNQGKQPGLIDPLPFCLVGAGTAIAYSRGSSWVRKRYALILGMLLFAAVGVSYGESMGFLSLFALILTLISLPILPAISWRIGLTERPVKPARNGSARSGSDRKPRHLFTSRKRLIISVAVILVLMYLPCRLLFALNAFSTRLSPGITVSIVRHPHASGWGLRAIKTIPAYDPRHADNPFQIDLRSVDLSQARVIGRGPDLIHADFDTRTKWPAAIRQLEPSFSPQTFLKIGMNPGLGVRDLHRQGITGKGVGIAIIDQALLVDHVEYKDRIRMYEEIHLLKTESAEMHGPAVASIAVGKNLGVAPGADLYYIAETHVSDDPISFGVTMLSHAPIAGFNFHPLADSINRILDVNARLPQGRKIRVISISVGWSPVNSGYRAVRKAVARAEREGVFVVSTSLGTSHGIGMDFMGLGREPRSDPDNPSSYGPGSWWAKRFFEGQPNLNKPMLLVPMDSLTYASCQGVRDYEFSASGGLSWSVPYIAGLYALACQVKPTVTPQEFWSSAMSTGSSREIMHNGRKYRLEKIVNPKALIQKLH